MSADVLVIGAGREGLAAAGLLAADGRDVVVLERADAPGGLDARREVHPDHFVPGLPLPVPRLHPAVAGALDLERHGLELAREDPPMLAVDGAGGTLRIPEEAGPDAAGLARLEAFVDRVGGFVRDVLDGPAPDVLRDDLPEAWRFARTGLALRRLGTDDMRELLRVAPMCSADWFGEEIESQLLRAALGWPGSRCGFLGPWSAGTAAAALLWRCARTRPPVGGPVALVEALAEAAAARGAKLRTGVEVRVIRLEGGELRGVELEGGEIVEAQVVLASCDPRRALLELLPPRALPLTVAEEARTWRTRGTAAVVDLALDGPIEYAGRSGEVFEWARVGAHVDENERAFDACKFRRLPQLPQLEVWMPSAASPGLAPAGHHVASLLVHFVPHDLEGGWNDERRAELESLVLARLEQAAPGVGRRVLAARTWSPVDLERHFAVHGGHLLHGDVALDQLATLRPGAHLSHHATPVDGFYLCGRGTHPGPFVAGGSAALAVRAIQGRARGAQSAPRGRASAGPA